MARRVLSLLLFGFLVPSSGCNKPASSAPPTAVPSREMTAAVAPADTDPVAADAPDVSLAEDKRPRIVCFGDSLTAGYGTDPGESYPDVLQRQLNSGGYKYRVVNEGISGNTTKDGLARVDRVLRLRPALVVVEFGGNDGLRGIAVEQSRRNLDAILEKLQAGHAPFAIAGITLPPDYGPEYVRHFNETYTLLAAKYHAPLLPFLLEGVYGTAGMMQPDGIHATAKGNTIVAQSVMKLIQPQLKK